MRLSLLVTSIYQDLGMDTKTGSPPSLADALGDVRAEIKALKAHEAELRQALLDLRPNGPIHGARFEVIIRNSERRLIDTARLPDFIRDDAQFWKRSRTTTVISRPCPAPVPVVWNREDELIEPF